MNSATPRLLQMTDRLDERLHQDLVDQVYLVLTKHGLSAEIHESMPGQQLQTFVNSSLLDVAGKVRIAINNFNQGPRTPVGMALVNQTAKTHRRHVNTQEQNAMIRRLP